MMVAVLLVANGVALINMGRDSAAQPLLEQARKRFSRNQTVLISMASRWYTWGTRSLVWGTPSRRAPCLRRLIRSPRHLAKIGSCPSR